MNDIDLISTIKDYLDGNINLDEFEDWYIPNVEFLVDNPGTANITSQLELELAELQAGLQSENELKNNLRIALENSRPKINYQVTEYSSTSGSSITPPNPLDLAVSSPVEFAVNWGDLVPQNC